MSHTVTITGRFVAYIPAGSVFVDPAPQYLRDMIDWLNGENWEPLKTFDFDYGYTEMRSLSHWCKSHDKRKTRRTLRTVAVTISDPASRRALLKAARFYKR